MLYVSGNLTTALGEVFGDLPVAHICPGFRASLVRPAETAEVLDLRGQGAAMSIGALPSLATGSYPRVRTQEWARAIFEDQPVPERTVAGVYYNAAHTNGPALALWNTDGRVESFEDHQLSSPHLWPRVVSALDRINVSAVPTGSCPRCR